MSTPSLASCQCRNLQHRPRNDTRREEIRKDTRVLYVIMTNVRRTALAMGRNLSLSPETAEGFGMQPAVPLGSLVEEKLASLTKVAEKTPCQLIRELLENILEQVSCTPSLIEPPAAPRTDVTMEGASPISTQAPPPPPKPKRRTAAPPATSAPPRSPSKPEPGQAPTPAPSIPPPGRIKPAGGTSYAVAATALTQQWTVFL